MGPIELINPGAGEMGQFLHHTSTQQGLHRLSLVVVLKKLSQYGRKLMNIIKGVIKGAGVQFVADVLHLAFGGSAQSYS